MLKRIKAWKTRKFLAQQAPVFTRGDGGQWILDAFEREHGRPFNPFNREDRHDVELGLSLALVRAWRDAFPEFH